MNYKSYSILIISLCLSAQLAFSNSELNTSDSVTAESLKNLETSTIPPGWRLFGGFATGYGRVSSNEYSSAPDGSQFLLNGEVSYLFPHWELQGGVGWFYSHLSGRSGNQAPVTITTRSGLADLSPRYRITDHWQLGPVLNLAFGTDTALGPQVGQSGVNPFLGLKAVYEFRIQQFPVQLWAQASKDLSIPDRQAVLAFIGIQFGLPLSQKETPTHSLVARMSPEPAPSVRMGQQLRIFLDYQKVFFKKNSTALKPGVSEVLSQLGDYLRDNPENTAAIEISGHADQRGSFAYNLKLSKMRSNSVRDILVSSGVDPAKLKVNGFSYSKPIDSKSNPIAWAKNRRVEMIFNQVRDAEKLKTILAPLVDESPLFN